MGKGQNKKKLRKIAELTRKHSWVESEQGKPCASDPEPFFTPYNIDPETGDKIRESKEDREDREAIAKELCNNCRFASNCLEYALDQLKAGLRVDSVHAGRDPKELKVIAKQRRAEQEVKQDKPKAA